MGYFTMSTEAPVLGVARGLGTVLVVVTNACGSPSRGWSCKPALERQLGGRASEEQKL